MARSVVARAEAIAAAAHERMAGRCATAIVGGAGGRSRASLKQGGSVLVFGNGGSAADAQHFAAELVGRYEQERRGVAGDRADDATRAR